MRGRSRAVVERFMPVTQPGAGRVDDRRVVSGIVHVLKSGCRWRDCPAVYGPHTTVYNRFNRWSRRGFWRAMLAALAAAGWVAETAALDSTYVSRAVMSSDKPSALPTSRTALRVRKRIKVAAMAARSRP